MAGARQITRWRSLAARFELVRECAAASRRLTALTGALVVLGGLLPAVFAVVAGVLVSAVPPAVGRGFGTPAGHRVVVLFAVATALYVLMQVLGPVQAAMADTLWRKVDESLATRLMRAVSAPRGIAHLEDPLVLDRVAQAQRAVTGNTAGEAVTQLVAPAQRERRPKVSLKRGAARFRTKKRLGNLISPVK